jgi:hypothetical protein
MNCTNCGAELRPGARFCAECGAPQATHPATVVLPEQPEPPPPRRPPTPPPRPPAPKRRWPWIVGGIAAVVLLLCICAGAIALLVWLGVLNLGQGAAGEVTPPSGEAPVRPETAGRVGPEGGEVVAPGGAKLVVPEGTLKEEVDVGLSETAAAPELPAEYLASAAGPAYEVTLPEGTELEGVVELLLPLERQAGADESLYTVFRWDGSRWWDVGGVVEGDFIRVQLAEISIFQPVYGYQDRRPINFHNRGPQDAIVRPWTYVPLYTDTPAPPPATSVSVPGFTTSLQRHIMSLPLGSYDFCVEFRDDQGQWRHYIHDWIGGVGSNDPLQPDLAETVDVSTDVISARAGRCGVAPLATEPGPAEGGPPAPGAGDVTVRLTWRTTDDLDLHVTDPNGEEIYYGNRQGVGGGQLDRDSNVICIEQSTSPVENVFWPTGLAPRGSFTARVNYFSDCDDVAPVEFRLRIMVDGRVIYDESGTLSGEDDDFTYPFTR